MHLYLALERGCLGAQIWDCIVTFFENNGACGVQLLLS